MLGLTAQFHFKPGFLQHSLFSNTQFPSVSRVVDDEIEANLEEIPYCLSPTRSVLNNPGAAEQKITPRV